MLTEIDVMAHWYKQKKYAIPPQSPSTNSEDYRDWFILINVANRIASISQHPQAAQSLFGFDFLQGRGLYHPNMTGKYPSFQFDPVKPWLYRLRADCTGWEIDTNFYDTKELDTYIMTANKANALDHLFKQIDSSRYMNFSYFDHCQGRVYQSKVTEAKEIIDKGVEEDTLLKYPFVSGYARVAGIGLQEASKQILVKHVLSEAAIAEMESLRVKGKRLICGSQTMEELHHNFNRITTELGKYGSL